MSKRIRYAVLFSIFTIGLTIGLRQSADARVPPSVLWCEVQGPYFCCSQNGNEWCQLIP